MHEMQMKRLRMEWIAFNHLLIREDEVGLGVVNSSGSYRLRVGQMY